jgi:hypothetical protein
VTTPLLEPFNNLTNWTTVAGAPAIGTGRTGNGLTFPGSSGQIRYTIPVASESNTVIVGYALKIAAYSGGTSQMVWVYSDADATQHTGVRLGSAGEVQANRGSSISLGTSATGAIPVNTWCYVETRFILGDAPNGSVEVRVDGTTKLNVTAQDTKNAGTKTVYDTVHIYNATSWLANYDDLYVACGAAEPFKGDIHIGATMKVYNGTAFVDGNVKVYNGTAFVDATAVKTWNGSAWV